MSSPSFYRESAAVRMSAVLDVMNGAPADTWSAGAITTVLRKRWSACDSTSVHSALQRAFAAGLVQRVGGKPVLWTLNEESES